MFLKHLELNNFKNYARLSVAFKERINLLYGNNGSGKTNVLDAIHFLSFGKSHFHLSDSALILDSEDYYRLVGTFNHPDDKRIIVSAKYKRNGRREFGMNNKKLPRTKDLLGKHPVVLVAPDDISIVYGGSSERRDYVNRILCQSNPDYLSALMKYNRILRQKDALLKNDRRPSRLEVTTYNYQLMPLAEQIHTIRINQIGEISNQVHSHYVDLTGNMEVISMEYVSQLLKGNIEQLYDRQLDQEIASRRPLLGIQRDDVQLLIGGKEFKKFGSQGQVKSLLYSLRMGEYHYLATALQCKPILMLDDYFEKLDSSRLSALLKMISQEDFGQVFLTDTELERSQKILDQHGITFDSFHIANGELEE